jgi:hypothetical protein
VLNSTILFYFNLIYTNIFPVSNVFPYFNYKLLLKDKQSIIHDWSHKQKIKIHNTQALRDKKGQVERQASVDRLVRIDDAFFEISHESKTNLLVL